MFLTYIYRVNSSNIKIFHFFISYWLIIFLF
nr:MAG TPA: hypothetical protein [Bacteriophage sp.]